jgi:hypothetical protein
MGGFGMMKNLIKQKNKMGLLVNATEEKKILIKGTEIEIPSVYVRLEYMCPKNGKQLFIGMHTYNSKDAYKSGASEIATNLEISSIVAELQDGEEQCLAMAEIYSKAKYEELEYITTVL